jgi:hypothetical protein
MLTYLYNNKWKLLTLFVASLLIWIGYASWKEYETLSEKCARVGGTIVYNAEEGKMYCNVPRPRPTQPRSWFDGWW